MDPIDLDIAAVARRLQRWTAPLDDAQSLAHAAVATLLRQGSGGAEVLLIERAEQQSDPWSGHLAFPGGKRDAGDPSLLATAVRETREEVGVALDPVACLARLGDVVARVDGYRAAQFVFALDETPCFSASDEVAAILWLPLARIATPEAHTTFERTGPGGETLTLPCLRLGARVLWGMTYRMAQQLVEALQQPQA